MQSRAALLLVIVLFFTACKKDHVGDCKTDRVGSCESLRDDLAANDKTRVEVAVNNAIAQLHSNEHTAKNLADLATALSSRCGVTATVLCFGCIYTYLGQSEMKVSFNSGGATITKVIDITSKGSNKMVFVNMHD